MHQGLPAKKAAKYMENDGMQAGACLSSVS
jgi:hypothetical protein